MGMMSKQPKAFSKEKRKTEHKNRATLVQPSTHGMVVPRNSKTQFNQSLVDGITTLQALATSDHPVGSRELARRLEMDSSKVNRL